MSTIRNAEGYPFSKWRPAEKFIYMMEREQSELAEHCEAEYGFDEHRAWRFDFAWPSVRVAVEIDGLGVGGRMGGHQRAERMANDNEKQNAATLQGWRVIRFNSRQLGSMAGVVDAVDVVTRCICDMD